MSEPTSSRLEKRLIKEIRSALADALDKGALYEDVTEALRRYDDSTRCHGHAMVRCKLESGHKPPCDYETDRARPPEREPGDSMWPPCPGFGSDEPGSYRCPHAGKWGAGADMPPVTFGSGGTTSTPAATSPTTPPGTWP